MYSNVNCGNKMLIVQYFSQSFIELIWSLLYFNMSQLH